MITCPHCGTLNRPTAKFCGSCGKQINPAPILTETSSPPDSFVVTAADAPGEPFEEQAQPSVPESVQDIVTLTEASVEPKPDGLNADSAETTNREDNALNSAGAEPAAVKAVETTGVQSLDAAIPLVVEQIAPEPTKGVNDDTPAEPAAVLVEQTAAESSDPLTSPPSTTKETQSRSLLEIGLVFQDRFTILEILAQERDMITYRARDAWRCPICEFVNEADAVFCSNCGRELNERGTVLLIERNDSGDLIPPAEFVLNTRAYWVQPDVPTAAPSDSGTPHTRLQFAVASDVGIVHGSAREPNEDSAFALALSAVHESAPHPTVGIFIIADGVGGSAAGELASKRAIQVLATGMVNTLVAPILQGEEMEDAVVREKIRAAVLDANAQVIQLAAEKQNDMGTTVTLAFVLDTRAYIANVGDSRTYLLRDAKLAPISRDHSLVASLVAADLITAEEAYDHPQRNIILRSLGANTDLEVDVFPSEGGALSLQSGDRLLLCSDGLWEMVRDFDLESVLLRELDLNKAASSMIALANENGGADNISLVIVNVLS